MTTSIESVTAASKLRREKAQVQEELTQKRKDCKELMEQVRRREEDLRAERAELQEQLVKFYKYIQDNEMKRAHHNKKAKGEERAKEERHESILKATEEVKQKEREKIELRRKVARLSKYETYLTDVLTHNDNNEEFSEPSDLIERFRKLDAHRALLKLRQEQLQDELAKAKVSLALRHQRNKGESVNLELSLNELQGTLSKLQKDNKNRSDDLDVEVRNKSDTKRDVGQMRMACGNLYDRCVAVLTEYRGRGAREEKTQMTDQLTVIGDCLSDLIEVVRERRSRKEKDQTDLAKSSPMRNRSQPPQAASGKEGAAAAVAAAGSSKTSGRH